MFIKLYSASGPCCGFSAILLPLIEYLFNFTSDLIVYSSLFLPRCSHHPFMFYLHCKFCSLPFFTSVFSQLFSILILLTKQKHFPLLIVSYSLCPILQYPQSHFTVINLSSVAVEAADVVRASFCWHKFGCLVILLC